jgi:transglutaminase-like putative cysteine protease
VEPGWPALTARISWPDGCGLALTAALAAAAGASFQRVTGFAPLLPVLGVAAAIPAVLSAAGRRLPLWCAIPASLGCWFLIASVTLLHEIPGAGTIATVRSDISDGWWLMLTTILPASATPRVLLGVDLLVWLGSMAAAETVLRTRLTLPAVLPGLVILLAGLALGVDGPGSDSVPTAAVLLFAGLLLVARTASGPHVVRGVALVIVAALAAVAAGPRLPLASAHTPFDPRRYVHPAADVQALTSPLDDVSLWLSEPRLPLFRVTASAPEDWQLTVLDTFDGQTWSASGSFTDTGGRVPPAASAPPPSGAVTETVTIQNLTGVWLPEAGRPSTVTGVPVDVDPVTDVLLDRTRLSAGLVYRVVSGISAPGPAELRAATVADDADARADLALPAGTPPVIARTAQAAGAAFPFQQAVLLASYLFAREQFDPAAPPGHSYGAISYFLSVSHQGTSEQFATAYALMARALGLPSRIIVGFRPGTVVRPGTWQVNGADALVWPEVDFARIGWVAFYPTPATPGRGLPRGVPAGQTLAQQTLDQRIGGASPPPARGGRQEGAVRRSRSTSAPVSGRDSLLPVMLVAGAVLMVAGYLSGAFGVPAWRRRKRRRGEPAARVAGAWAETLDCLRSCGLRPAPALSAPEIAALGGGHLGSRVRSALPRLASLTDRALFAPVPVDDAAAAEAWQLCEAIRREAAARTTWRGQLAARLRLAGRPRETEGLR